MLDTLAYARQLKAAGFSESQAEGIAQVIGSVVTDRLVTKDDLRALEQRLEERFERRFQSLEQRIAEVEARTKLALEAGLANLENRLTIRMGVMLAGTVGLLTAVQRLL